MCGDHIDYGYVFNFFYYILQYELCFAFISLHLEENFSYVWNCVGSISRSSIDGIVMVA